MKVRGYRAVEILVLYEEPAKTLTSEPKQQLPPSVPPPERKESNAPFVILFLLLALAIGVIGCAAWQANKASTGPQPGPNPFIPAPGGLIPGPPPFPSSH